MTTKTICVEGREMTGIAEKIASLEAAAKEAHDYTNMPMEVDPRDILELNAHIRELLEERDALKAENDRLKEALDRCQGGSGLPPHQETSP